MTYEEAIEDKELLEDAINHFKSLQKRYTREHNGKMCTKVAVALESMEKQIPKKPIRQHEKYQRWYNDKFFCPSCGESAETDCGDPFANYGLDWCNHCGQAIDWSE